MTMSEVMVRVGRRRVDMIHSRRCKARVQSFRRCLPATTSPPTLSRRARESIEDVAGDALDRGVMALKPSHPLGTPGGQHGPAARVDAQHGDPRLDNSPAGPLAVK